MYSADNLANRAPRPNKPVASAVFASDATNPALTIAEIHVYTDPLLLQLLPQRLRLIRDLSKLLAFILVLLLQ
jgi:hypothetical protein